MDGWMPYLSALDAGLVAVSTYHRVLGYPEFLGARTHGDIGS